MDLGKTVLGRVAGCTASSMLVITLPQIGLRPFYHLALHPSPSLFERVLDDQSVDPLAMLQVFAVEPGTSGVEGGGDDQGVVETVAVARLDIEGAVIKPLAGP